MVTYKLNNGKEINVFADFHTHTIYSGHGMATPEQMAESAAHLGLEFLAITDHIYEYTLKSDIENQNCRASLENLYLSGKFCSGTTYDGTTGSLMVIGGGEFNAYTNNPAYNHSGLKLFGYHSWFNPNDREQDITIDNMLNQYELYAYKDNKPDIFVHLERIAPIFKDKAEGMYFIEQVVKLAAKYGIAIEANTSSLVYAKSEYKKNELVFYINWLFECLYKSRASITLGSDSHACVDICINFKQYLEWLDEAELLDKVINLDFDKCEAIYRKASKFEEH